ncbi:M14 family metallopeptidase [Paenibacillus spongiae]|uniref:M14 family metallocarboxypeptidase n=1 Tax=Paenibacillus spongiae TaxID=2909671 RepID=A0ABY5SD51_9BACL|nr:M14 family metallocarboxypeptidase [Paenibacillus spongiae]UVI31460.1 M14 family metallocarboxypeptidase [Paenibacillus spongiae]
MQLYSQQTSTRYPFRWIALLCALTLLLLAIPGTSTANGQAAAPAIVKPQQIYTYDRMSADLQSLAARYPDLIRTGSAGESEYGRKLWTADIGNGPAIILLLGSHHAREWITTVTMMKLMEQIAVQYENNAVTPDGYRVRDLLDRVTFRLVPMVNPDGVTLQQLGLSAFPASDHASLLRMNGGSANFKRWKANAKGIDLNRQYPAGWANIKNPAPGPYYMNYRGKQPLQAKEAKAMYDLARSVKPEVAVAYHSSGEILYWNFKTKPANVARDYQFASSYAKLTGYRLVQPQANPSGGGFTDWFIQDFGRPGLTPELGRSAGETHVPLSEWPRIWGQHKNTGWFLAQTGYELWLQRQQTAPLTSNIRLTSSETSYLYPDLKSKQAGILAPGRYATIRMKGDWLEVRTSSGTSWISSRAVLSGPYEKTENMTVTLGPDIGLYDSPLAAAPSAIRLTEQSAPVRERWKGWLFVETTGGMRWLKESELPKPQPGEETPSENTDEEKAAAETE